MYNDNQTDDDDFFIPTPRSNLAKLFNNPNVGLESFNQTLTYTAPQQPKSEVKASNNVSSSKPKVASSVICAKPVILSKLVDGKYSTIGKYGLALIGSDTIKAYELIMYKDTRNVLVRTKVCDKFIFILQNDNFATFYDDHKQNWLVRFESADASDDFVQIIEKHGVRIDRSIRNSKNNSSKQDINIKPDLKDDTVLQNENKTIVKNLPSLDDIEKPGDIQSDSSGTQTRANILSRMAKMGQQILPRHVVKDSVSDLSDSDADVAIVNKKPVQKIKRNHSKDKDLAFTSSDVKDQTSKCIVKQVPMVDESANYKMHSSVPYVTSNRLIPVAKMPTENQIALSQQEVHPTLDHLNLLFNENRIHNSEVKLNMSQISLKLEQVLFELQQSKSIPTPTDVDCSKSKIKALELKISNLNQELTKAEEHIRKCAAHEELIAEQNEIIKKKEEIFKTLTQNCQQEFNHEIEEYKQQIIENENVIKELQQTVDNQKLKLKDFEEFYNENKNNTDSQKMIQELNSTIDSLNLKLKDFEEYYKVNEFTKSELRKQESDKANAFTEKLKLTMNLMFHNVIESFKSDTDDATFQGSFIASVLAQNIKATTYKIIEECQKDFAVNDEAKSFNPPGNFKQELPEADAVQT